MNEPRSENSRLGIRGAFNWAGLINMHNYELDDIECGDR